jgi:hypothetical protein
MKHKLLLFSFIILSCGVEDSDDDLINNNQVSVSEDSSTGNSTANDTSPNNSQLTESSTYLGTNCKEVSYSSKPDADYVNGDYSYYTYGWQLDGTDQNSCVNAYNGVTAFGVDLVNAVLSDAKEKLGQIVPVNAWIFHTQNSDIETICSDYSPLQMIQAVLTFNKWLLQRLQNMYYIMVENLNFLE